MVPSVLVLAALATVVLSIITIWEDCIYKEPGNTGIESGWGNSNECSIELFEGSESNFSRTIASFWRKFRLIRSEDLVLNFDYYCDDELQCQGEQNTMCNATLKFGPSCADFDAEYVPMTDELKQLFVDGHNKLRNEQALGKTGHLFSNKTVADMATVSWDDELELMSLSNALNCQFAHDRCRDTARYKMAGQNIGVSCRSWALLTEEEIPNLIQSWYDEYKLVTNLEEVKRLGSSHGIGHWSQVVQSKANRIGCSAIKLTKSNCVMIGCNYNAGNLRGFPIFTFGAPASLCKTGTNPEYPGLCNPSEDFSQHENGKIYFKENAPESPIVEQWSANGKKLNL